MQIEKTETGINILCDCGLIHSINKETFEVQTNYEKQIKDIEPEPEPEPEELLNNEDIETTVKTKDNNYFGW